MRLQTKLEVNESTALALRAYMYFIWAMQYLYMCNVLLLLGLGCVFCLWNWNMTTIISYCSPVEWRAPSSGLISVAFIFCLCHYREILHTAIFWIHMLQYFMWLQVFVLLWINVFFSVSWVNYFFVNVVTKKAWHNPLNRGFLTVC